METWQMYPNVHLILRSTDDSRLEWTGYAIWTIPETGCGQSGHVSMNSIDSNTVAAHKSC